MGESFQAWTLAGRAALVGRVERLFDCGNDFALHRKGLARDPRSSRGGVAAPTELRGDGIDVHLLALRPQTDAGHLRLHFLEHARYYHRGNGRSEEHTSELQSLRHLVCRL